MSIEEVSVVSLDEQGCAVLLPTFQKAVEEGWKEIAHAVFVETLQLTSGVLAVIEIFGDGNSSHPFLPVYAEQLTSMMRIVTSRVCDDCGECQEKELWWRMTETARAMAEKKPGLRDIVSQLEQISIKPATCCQREC